MIKIRKLTLYADSPLGTQRVGSLLPFLFNSHGCPPHVLPFLSLFFNSGTPPPTTTHPKQILYAESLLLRGRGGAVVMKYEYVKFLLQFLSSAFSRFIKHAALYILLWAPRLLQVCRKGRKG